MRNFPGGNILTCRREKRIGIIKRNRPPWGADVPSQKISLRKLTLPRNKRGKERFCSAKRASKSSPMPVQKAVMMALVTWKSGGRGKKGNDRNGPECLRPSFLGRRRKMSNERA